MTNPTPKQQGYFFPAEWTAHEATWLTWPYRDDSFLATLDKIYPSYCQFISYIARSEKVRILVPSAQEARRASEMIQAAGANMSSIELFVYATNDVWCRDHGPAFLIPQNKKEPKVIVDWEFNAWGNKYPSHLDNGVPAFIAQQLGLKTFRPGIIMEGGSVDFNGAGTLLTTEACLLNPNRNPHLSQAKIEEYLREYYGVDQILWLGDGIVGDDTDGHVDDICRFVNEDTVIATIESKTSDDNYAPLQDNLKRLKSARLINGRQLNIIELPMPHPVVYQGQRLPASYANFYICNSGVMVPVFRCKEDNIALKIIEQAFPTRTIYDIDCSFIVTGFGTLHCLSQQEPLLKVD
ncbi:MAG: agmatine deiminase family protein [Bacteroidales bacterium]|nr:agmatine deiminase family protein [Bacteroidales bacterium]HOK97557.1 agmatine deiminase family protein [Bacteroidales bacterium]HPO64377.1 agmatine deiminase family protein [Bacteroidales bacterium]